jgi:hydroxyacylglutathione hydrolase
MLEIFQIPVLNDNYIYLITDAKSGKTACVDPALHDPVIEKLEELDKKLDFILNTHHHNDHVGANLQLKARIPGISIFVNEGDTFKLGDSECRVIEVSGHTLGHICYYFSKESLIFCGDTLFSLGCGRLFEGTPDVMVESLLKIRSLPNNTKVYCAHEYTLNNANFALSLEPKNNKLKKKIEQIKTRRSKGLSTIPSTLGEEKILNPFLRFDNDAFIKSVGLKKKSNVENFKVIREMKDNF